MEKVFKDVKLSDFDRVSAELISHFDASKVILFYGHMGAGKTTLMTEFIECIKVLEHKYGNFEVGIGHSLGGMALLNSVKEGVNFQKSITIGAGDIISDIIKNFVQKLELETIIEEKIKMHFYNHGSTGGAAISGFLSGFTLGIIPGMATDNYTLKLDVNQGDKNIIEQVSDDALNTYIGIWFIPIMGNTPEKGFDEVISNMIKDSLSNMVESKQLHYAAISPLLINKG